jgi:uncharacterized protein (TIGR02996 family)
MGIAMQRNLELERAILAAPDDPQPWSVYADWLQSRGDPWGERLTLELQREQTDDEDELVRIAGRLAQLQRQHGGTIMGERLSAWINEPDFADIVDLDWHYGFVLGLRVGSLEDVELPVSEVLAAILASPACCMLRRISVGITDPSYPTSLRSAVTALAAGPVHEHLVELFLGDFAYPDECEISWVSVGDITGVLARCPALRHLHVRGADIELGDALVHPTLETLVIETGGLPARACAAVGRAWLPELRSMEVWFGRREYGGDGSIEQLAPLFGGAGLPALRHLALKNSEFQDAIAHALVHADILAQLKSVSLGMGILRKRGGEALLAAADRLRHLTRIDLDFNWLSAELAAELVRVLPRVHIGERNEPPPTYFDDDEDDEGDGDYYTQVGE